MDQKVIVEEYLTFSLIIWTLLKCKMYAYHEIIPFLMMNDDPFDGLPFVVWGHNLWVNQEVGLRLLSGFELHWVRVLTFNHNLFSNHSF